MNKLSKILIGMIAILAIALVIISVEYIKMKKVAMNNLNLYLEAETRYSELHNQNYQNSLDNEK